jgi:hypothetical protein
MRAPLAISGLPRFSVHLQLKPRVKRCVQSGSVRTIGSGKRNPIPFYNCVATIFQISDKSQQIDFQSRLGSVGSLNHKVEVHAHTCPGLIHLIDPNLVFLANAAQAAAPNASAYSLEISPNIVVLPEPSSFAIIGVSLLGVVSMIIVRQKRSLGAFLSLLCAAPLLGAQTPLPAAVSGIQD